MDCVVVQWDSGEKNVYRAGYDKCYDLRLYDSATIGKSGNLIVSQIQRNLENLNTLVPTTLQLLILWFYITQNESGP